MSKRKHGLKIWNPEIKELVKNKKQAYLNYLNNRTDQNRINYNKTRAEVKRYTRTLNRNHWDTYIAEMEHNLHGRQDKVYKFIRNLNSTEKDRAKLEIIGGEVFENYYKELWNIEETKEEQIVKNIGKEEIDKLELEELLTSIKKSKNHKACGIDNINLELLKYAPKELHERLLYLYNLCWEQKNIPEEWRIAKVVSIFKKGDKSKPENYRGISLLCAAYKIYAKMISFRLNKITDVILLEEQSGFRRGRSCIDNVFALKQIIEKRREKNLETHLLFVDYFKAFDKVSRPILWRILENRGIPLHLIEVVKCMYKDTKIKIKERKPILINCGVRQGCPLSTELFNLFIDEVVRIWKSRVKGGINIAGTEIKSMMFADDQILLATNEDDLQRMLHWLNNVTKEYGMKISAHKTKTMAFKGTQPVRSKIILDNIIIEQVSKFKYLGCNVSYQNEYDIDEKITKFSYITGTLQRTLKYKARKDSIVKLYKSMAIPTLTYGSETWTIYKRHFNRIQSTEMKFLRSIAGFSKLDKKRNHDIRQELKVDEINEIINTYRKNWSQHILRMTNDRYPKLTFLYQPTGKRSQGRPLKRWTNQFGAGTDNIMSKP